MKKIRFILAILATVCSISIQAGNDRAISASQLPQNARSIIKAHFSKQKIALSKVENNFISKTYDVIMDNGDKLEFDRKGMLTEVSCKRTEVPAALIPVQIQKYVKAKYPKIRILQYEIDGSNKDVTLSNGLELVFNSRFQVIDIDD